MNRRFQDNMNDNNSTHIKSKNMNENLSPTVTMSDELVAKERMAKMQFELSPIGQMVKQFEVQQRMAQMFAKSQIVPKQYQNNIADCAIALDMAMRMNCNPLTVMQNLVIVQGRPTWQSQFLIACINQSGRFTTMQFRQWQDGVVGKIEYEDNVWDEVSRRNKLVKKTFDGTNVPNYCCQAFATEKSTGETVTGAEISVRMAVMERWYTKSGSKWQTMPKQMLIYRAAAFFQRAYCPEISMGFHTTDEIQDAVVVDEAQDTPTGNSSEHRTLDDIAQNAFEAASTLNPTTADNRAAEGISDADAPEEVEAQHDETDKKQRQKTLL